MPGLGRSLVFAVLAGATFCTACGDERGAPPGGTTPLMTTGPSSNAATSGPASSTTTSMMNNVTCDDEGVICATQIYFGDCSAFPGMRPLWTFLSFDTSVPDDARVEFSVRTADVEADLNDASYVLAGTATTDAPLVPPSVPIMLDEILSPGDVIRPYLELRIARIDSPSGGSPGVEEWDLFFTCEDF